MLIRFIVLPLMSALIGWLIIRVAMKWLFRPKEAKRFAGITIQGLFPARQQQLAETLGKLVSEKLFSFSVIENKITNPENIKKIMPQVEEHIDHFLRIKLKETMPMISMFIGDKTIHELKTVFMNELEILFPQVLKNYLANLQQDLDLEQMVTSKVAGIDAGQVESMLKQLLVREFRYVQIMGAVTGFIIGLVQIIVTLLMNRAGW